MHFYFMHFADGSEESCGPELIVFDVNGEFYGERLLVELHKTPGVHTVGSLSRGKINQPFFSPVGGKLTDHLKSQKLDRERGGVPQHGIMDPC